MITWIPWEEVDDLWSFLKCNEVLVADEENEGNRQEVPSGDVKMYSKRKPRFPSFAPRGGVVAPYFLLQELPLEVGDDFLTKNHPERWC